MTKFTSALGKEICQRTAGSTIGLRHICKQLNVPYSTVTGWIYDKDHELHDNYQDAKEQQLQYLVDEIYNISDNGTNDFMTVVAKNGKSKEVQKRESIARSKLRINARMMVISKLAPILRGRTRHIRGKYEVLDNENTELQDDQHTTEPAAKVEKAVAKQENRAAKNIGGSSPKKTLKRKPGKASISGARAVSGKAAQKKAGSVLPKPQPNREPKYGDPDWPSHLPPWAPYNSKDSWPDYGKHPSGGPGVYR